MNDPLHSSASDSYDPAFFDLLSSVESRHFWFTARTRILGSLVKSIAADMTDGFLVLEAGCGNGNLLQALEEPCSHGTVVGIDLFAEGLRLARGRVSTPLVQGDINHLPFRRPFELICCFDVLEHQQDDSRVLAGIGTALADHGVLVLTVPAHPSLWSYFDEASNHFRRYELAELRNRLHSAGYHVDYITHYMLGILPLLWLRRKVASLIRPPSDHGRARACLLASDELRVLPLLNGLLGFLLSQEARLIARRRCLPAGSSLLAVARRR